MADAADLRIRVRSVTLAAYLIELGKEYQLSPDGVTPSGAPLGAWEFKQRDDVREAMEAFQHGDALVEPAAYYRAVKRVRSELFDYLGIGNAKSEEDMPSPNMH